MLVAAVMLFLMPVEALAATYNAIEYSNRDLNVGDIVLSGDRINVVGVSGGIFYDNSEEDHQKIQWDNRTPFYIVKPGIWKVTAFDWDEDKTPDTIWKTFLVTVDPAGWKKLSTLDEGDIVEFGDVIETDLMCTFRENGTDVSVFPKEYQENGTTLKFIEVKEGRWKFTGYAISESGGVNTTTGFYLERVYTVTLSGGANATATPTGKTTQKDVGGSTAMETVTYTAEEGCEFPAEAEAGATEKNYITKNGITVARTSDNTVTVSGTPTADTTITVPGAEIIRTVTFKVKNGSWNTGDGPAATEDKTVTLKNVSADALKLSADQIPAVGNRPNENYLADGSWDVKPNTETVISKDTTYTYTYAAKPQATATEPTAKDLTYTGSAQDLVQAGSATGGTMKYAIGENDTTAPTTGWAKEIPQRTDAGDYHVWYKVEGDSTHLDRAPGYVKATIKPATISSVAVVGIDAPEATKALDTTATTTANVTLSAVTWNPTTTPAAYATKYTATVTGKRGHRHEESGRHADHLLHL